MTQNLTIHAYTNRNTIIEFGSEFDGTFEGLHEASNIVKSFPEVTSIFRVTIDGEPIIFEWDADARHLYVEDDRAKNMGWA
tara:strand:- start:350 stop:592 length:243 start_codon:yes stop_codon:yes gene_type:complete